MTIDQFQEYAKRTVAECRGVQYSNDDPRFTQRISMDEAARVLGRSLGTTYHYVSGGYLKRDNGRGARFAEFSLAELVRCAILIHVVRDPNISATAVSRDTTRTTLRRPRKEHAHVA